MTKSEAIPNEPLSDRWLRRFCSIGFVFAACLTVTVCLPLILPIAFICGFIRRNLRASGRAVLLVEIILVCEVIGVVRSFWLWIRYVCGFGGDLNRFLDDNFALQCWWGTTLARLGMALFKVRIRVENPFQTEGRPILLFVRHVSFVDTFIPVLLVSSPLGVKLRYLLKRELLWDPCLDIVGNRLPNYFVRRDSESREEVKSVARLADDLKQGEGVLIYPEGTRFSEARRARLIEKYSNERDHEKYRQVVELKHVLPPRLGGVLALLERNSRADVVFCAHAGLEDALNVRSLLNGTIVGRTVNVTFWTVAFEEIPPRREDRISWLSDEWQKVDAFVENYQGIQA